MIKIVDRADCCGCTACASVCPKNAISMVEDAEGFKYPQIDEDACVSCGLCLKTCPIAVRPEEYESNVKKAYALKHKDKEVLKNSTSGGAFTAISDFVLDLGGVVYGAAFDENMVVRHIRAESVDERNAMRGSKYVQSDLKNTFSLVKKDLKEGKRVLFSGTPCQVDGLKHYLGSYHHNLTCVDLICHGTPSPKLLKAHFELLERKYHSKVSGYSFRPKRWTWHVHRETVTFKNGKKRHSTPYTDLWRTIYYSRLANRPSCHSCRYSNLSRPGDLTIADCRGIDKIYPDFGSNEGVSLVFVNTDVGEKVFGEISDRVMAMPVSLDDVMQPPLRAPSMPNERRGEFMDVYFKNGYKKAIDSYFGRLYALKYYVKKILKR